MLDDEKLYNRIYAARSGTMQGFGEVAEAFRFVSFVSISKLLGHISRRKSQDAVCSGSNSCFIHPPHISRHVLESDMINPVLRSIFSEREISQTVAGDILTQM